MIHCEFPRQLYGVHSGYPAPDLGDGAAGELAQLDGALRGRAALRLPSGSDVRLHPINPWVATVTQG